MVSSFLGCLVALLAVDFSITQNNFFGADVVRTRISENLRGGMDIVMIDGREAGENLTFAVPAIEVTNGTGTNPDVLVLRRNLLSSVLNLCATITAGSGTTQIYFANSTTQSGCIYSAEAPKYTAWQTYRTSNGNTVDAFIYDSVAKRGEFFKYNGEGLNAGSNSYWITRSAGTWANTYTRYSSWIFLLEEWKYQLSGDTLQLIQNRNTANPYNVSFGVTGLSVNVLMQDGTLKSSFTTADDWTEIERVEPTLSAGETYRGQLMTRSLAGQFFPRNVLSN